jgi:hypothetical protein
LRISIRPPNPTALKCPSCGAECKVYVSRRWWWGQLILWLVLGTAIGWSDVTPIPVGWALGLTMAIAWQVAADRLYHAYWYWRHPTRCGGGGGVPEPARSSAN